VDQLKPLYHILKTCEPPDGHRENSVESLLRVWSATTRIPASMMKRWRQLLRSPTEVGSPHQRRRAVSAQTLTEAQERGLHAEISAARSAYELVTDQWGPQWGAARAGDIYLLGLHLDGDLVIEMPDPGVATRTAQ
jgi:hypothetical protein